LGVIIYELFHGQTPFHDVPLEDYYQFKMKVIFLSYNFIEKGEFEMKEELSKKARNIIKGLMMVSSEERLGSK